MRKIYIIVPKEKDKWKVSIGKSRKSFLSKRNTKIYIKGILDRWMRLRTAFKLVDCHLIVNYNQLHLCEKSSLRNDHVTETNAEWFNDGVYQTKKEFMFALEAFLE